MNGHHDMPDHLQNLVETILQLPRRERQVVLGAVDQAALPPAHRDVLYTDEVAAVLGLDRLARPDNAVQRLVDRGDLPRRKINGRLVFERGDVEKLVANGSRKSKRGRPRGSRGRRRSA